MINVGTNYTFTVVAAGGAGTLAYVWWFDDGVNPPHTVGGNAPQLDISDATRAHTGAYWVEVHDAYEIVPSNTANLYVALTILEHPQGGSIPEGGSWTLSVLADGGAGPINYQWKLEHGDHGSGSAVNVGDNASDYVITNATQGDAGTYWVEVSDNTDVISSDPAIVEVIPESQTPAARIITLVIMTLAFVLAGALWVHRRRAA